MPHSLPMPNPLQSLANCAWHSFSPLPPQVRRQFEHVIDSLHAQNFLKSQIA